MKDKGVSFIQAFWKIYLPQYFHGPISRYKEFHIPLNILKQDMCRHFHFSIFFFFTAVISDFVKLQWAVIVAMNVWSKSPK